MAVKAENWVVLKPGVPTRLHFVDHVVMPRVITDPFFKVPREVVSWVFRVDREDGKPVDKIFSVLSDRLKGELAGYIEGKRYREYEFTLLKEAPGTVPPRIVTVTPYTP